MNGISKATFFLFLGVSVGAAYPSYAVEADTMNGATQVMGCKSVPKAGKGAIICYCPNTPIGIKCSSAIDRQCKPPLEATIVECDDYNKTAPINKKAPKGASCAACIAFKKSL